VSQPTLADAQIMKSTNAVFDSTHSQRIPCECCGNTQFRPILCREDDTLIVRCERCQLEFVNPLPDPSAMQKLYLSEMVSDDPDKGYFSRYILERQKREKSFSKLYHTRLKLIEANKPGKGNLLDLGCGAGFFIKCAQDRGWSGHGLEMLPEYVQYAQESLGLHQVQQGSLDDSLPFPPETFDVVTMWDLIEHLRHPLACLEKINRATKPGGLLVIWTPNVKNSIFVKEQWLSYGMKQHIYFFSQNSLKQLLQKAGFKIDYIKTNKAKKGLFSRTDALPFCEENKPKDKLGKILFSAKRDLKNATNPMTYIGPLFDLAGYGFNMFIIASKTNEIA
jgi:2-polyprenyl-3-methyl-5-hydroxy-6-metoxy-1,4-benzoquinol methylase